MDKIKQQVAQILNEYKELFEAPDSMDYQFKISNILLHRETGVLIQNGIKKKYTRDGNKVTIQII